MFYFHLDNAIVDDMVSHDCSVSSNVAKRPDSLLADIVVVLICKVTIRGSC